MAAFPIILIAFVAAVEASTGPNIGGKDKPEIEPDSRYIPFGMSKSSKGMSKDGRCDYFEKRKANCHPKAQCIKKNGNLSCKCLPGYVGDGRLCKAPESKLDWCCKVADLYQSKLDKEIHSTKIRSEWVRKDCDSLVPDGVFGERTRKICKVDATCTNKRGQCEFLNEDCTEEKTKVGCRKFCNLCVEKGDKCTNENKIQVGSAGMLLKMSCMPNREWCFLAIELGHGDFGSDQEINDEWKFRRCDCETKNDFMNSDMRFMRVCGFNGD